MKTHLLFDAIEAAKQFIALAELDASRTQSSQGTPVSPRLRALASQAREALKEVK